MQCDICGRNKASIRKIDRTYGKGQHTVVIRNIPLATCSTCDARYFASNIFDNAQQPNLLPHTEVNHSSALCLT